jgi:hypothetical protein
MDLLEIYQERAAILEHEAKLPRAEAEWEAYQEMRRIYGRDNLPEQIHKIARKAATRL